MASKTWIDIEQNCYHVTNHIHHTFVRLKCDVRAEVKFQTMKIESVSSRSTFFMIIKIMMIIDKMKQDRPVIV